MEGFPRSVKLFYFSDSFFSIAVAIFSTLFNLHLLAVGFTADHIGSLQSVSSIAMALVAIPIGLAGDRWGRRRIYVAGSLLFAAPYLVMPWLTDYSLLMVAYTINTVGAALMFVTESPLLAGEVEPANRASVFSFMFINFFLWNAVGIQLAGHLSKWLPRVSVSTYELPLAIAGVCGLIAGFSRAFIPFREKVSVTSRPRMRLRPSRTTVRLALVSILNGAYGALLINFSNVT